MVELKNCKICGRIFQSNGFSEICPGCYKQDENDYNKIREYLYEHPYAKIFEVSLNLDIPVSRIKRYLREDRLQIVESSNLFLDCEKCGAPIHSGRYCDECITAVNHDFKVVFNEIAKKPEQHKLNFNSYKYLKIG
jgi:uncharacterized protein